MDEQDQAQQALVKMFRRDQTEVIPKRKPRKNPLTNPWLVGITAVIVVLAPVAFLVIYPRFGPVDTMTAFCRAEGAGDYTAAYALLSPHAQQHVSLAAFTQASQNANLETCNPSDGIPFIFGGAQSSLDVTYQVANSDSGLAGTMTFANGRNGWRVDAMGPDLLHLSS